jgi:hypothetical protein
MICLKTNRLCQNLKDSENFKIFSFIQLRKQWQTTLEDDTCKQGHERGRDKALFICYASRIKNGFPREGVEWVVREGVGAGGRNKPSLVCTYE